MGKCTLSRRRGAGSVFTAVTQKRKGASKMRIADYAERHGFVKGVVRQIIHDPGRGAPMMEIQYRSQLRYKRETFLTVAPEGTYTGQALFSGKRADLAVGNTLPLSRVPEGAVVCNVEAKSGDRGKLARAGGNYAIVVSHNPDTGMTRIRLPSGRKKSVQSKCRAMLGVVAGGGRIEKPLLKAGNAYWRWKNKRKNWPRVRGVARNPVEHPHGGGNHQHVGHSTSVRRSAPPGQKVGLIASRRTGRIRGGKKTLQKE